MTLATLQATLSNTMMASVTGVRRGLAAVLASAPFQLVSALVIGCVVPLLLRDDLGRLTDSLLSQDRSLIGTAVAIVFGFHLYRKMSALPGANSLMRVLPSFLVAYCAVLSVFLLWRFDYSRYQFAASFALVVLWIALVMVIIPRIQKWTVAIVQTRKVEDLAKISWIDWLPVNQPWDLPPRRIVLAADFSARDLSPEWEATLAREVLAGRAVLNAKLLRESLTGRVQINHLSENTLGHLSPDSLYGLAKRYLDVLTAAVAFLFLLPMMAAIMVAIRLDSPGPAIFRQMRIGHCGTPFKLYKFRSMRVQASEGLHADMTQADDERITSLGRFLRSTRLDELPQIINILRGEMSWIGPRPETERLSSWYETELPFYTYRHIVRPGITGWAQVQQGHVTSLTDVTEKLEYDFYYIKNFSIWLDILIAAKTLKVMISGVGSR